MAARRQNPASLFNFRNMSPAMPSDKPFKTPNIARAMSQLARKRRSFPKEKNANLLGPPLPPSRSDISAGKDEFAE